MKTPVTIDFETKPIGSRPNYPPEPVGVSIKWPGEKSYYYGFGHPTQNNCTVEQAKEALWKAWQSGLPLLFHNSKFDVCVAVEQWGFPMPDWRQIHDTMFLAYLADPHARSLGLKELAADELGWPPDEKNAMWQWMLTNKRMLLERYPDNGPLTPSKEGVWIWTVPGDVAGPYACGDVDRTAELFEYYLPMIEQAGMAYSYDTERELMPILMDNERQGMLVDVPGLIDGCENYGGALEFVEDWLRHELHASGLNFDADQDLASVLLQRGIVPEELMGKTEPTQAHPDGVWAVNKEDLRPEHFTGPNGAAIASVLGYRNRLKTCLSMFMEPWLRQANVNNGRITTNWNQVRGAKGGTRTGRPSTDKHNFLNISKSFDGRTDGYVYPSFLRVPSLPLCRKFVLPDPGQVWQHRDFDGQELRVFAHHECGQLHDAYLADPDTDPHAMVGSELLRLTNVELERTKVKVLNFQALYGGGIPAAQRKLNCTYAEAKQYKNFHDRALPGRKVLVDEIAKLVKRGIPIRTVGGRLYFVEEPRKVKGKWQEWFYKLINYLIQGGAADITKRALIEWYKSRRRKSRFLVTVYDEINISSDPAEQDNQMDWLREVMDADRLSVPMRSSGKRGPTWGDLVKCQ